MIDQAAFDRVLDEYVTSVRLYGIAHPVTVQPLVMALKYAPGAFPVEASARLVGMGLMPEPDGYSEDCIQAFTVENLLSYLGISPEDSRAAMGDVADQMLDLCVTADGCYVSKRAVNLIH